MGSTQGYYVSSNEGSTSASVGAPKLNNSDRQSSWTPSSSSAGNVNLLRCLNDKKDIDNDNKSDDTSSLEGETSDSTGSTSERLDRIGIFKEGSVDQMLCRAFSIVG